MHRRRVAWYKIANACFDAGSLRNVLWSVLINGQSACEPEEVYW
jgi:hypothetical protein